MASCDHALMLDYLLSLPFPVQIWGTVSSWASALLTGAGFIIAASVYWRDSNLGRSAQAKQISCRILGDHLGEEVRVLVENYSSNSVYHVRVEVRRIRLYTALLRNSLIPSKPEPGWDLDQMVEEYAVEYRKVTSSTTVDAINGERLAPEDSLICEISRPSINQAVVVSFLDVRGRAWEYGDLADRAPTLSKRRQESRRWLAWLAAIARPFVSLRLLKRRVQARYKSWKVELRIRIAEAFIEAVKQAIRDGVDEFLRQLREKLTNREDSPTPAQKALTEKETRGDS